MKSARWHSDVLRLAKNALAAGGERKGPITIEWDITGNTRCQRPYTTEIGARPSRANGQKMVIVKPGSKAPVYVHLTTPCRLCEACLLHRMRLWRMRALAEARAASRIWMGTLTLSPEQQFLALSRARRECREREVVFDELPAHQQLRLRDRQIAPDIQRYLKRVRAQAGGPMRYLCICEAHRSGAPHYHLLVFEGSVDYPIKHKVLKAQWRLGFSDFKLVKDKGPQVAYVCKYVAKSMGARVRASIDFGKPPVVVGPNYRRGSVNILTPEEEREDIPDVSPNTALSGLHNSF